MVTLAVSVAALSLSAFVGAYLRTFRRTAHVSQDRIEADGGHALRLSDGRVIEYFLYGDPTGTPLVLFHGGGLSGLMGEGWDVLAKETRVRVISLSMAGWGGSSPQRGRSYADGGRDALAVLDNLGVTGSLHIVGVSWGSGTAAAMAQLVSARVRSLMLIVPAWPSMGNQEEGVHQTFAEAGASYSATGMPVLDRLFQYYVMPHLDLVSVLKSLAPEDFKDLEATSPWMIEGMSKQLARGNKYHHEGACEMMRLLREGGADIFQSRGKLRDLGSRVSVWYCLHDQLAPANHGRYLASLLPSAHTFRFEKGHLGIFNDMGIFFKELLSNSDPLGGD